MKNSSARKGTLHFTPEDHQKIASLKKTAESTPCWDGAPPADCHRAVVCGVDIAFFLAVDREDASGQYQLHITGKEGQPALEVVQAMAVPFFGDQPFQILPDERHPARIRVLGLFFDHAGR
ncbi:MAG: hypothetical protein MPW14_08260 [Candidatus Manganitrophus sp.]|nr:hypothetical protein [Candidatus Manganitrophus sp.]WDT71024.1 MAG: hypothetical protein MPW17_20125 [Candidatus Manganitrophus sp.]WDT81696.1 MAG: hypothetical protein MPW14_08260 [Candidatus Manganitrophus sp.]